MIRCRILNGKMWILSQTSESEDLCLCGAPTPGSVGGDGRTGTHHKPWHLGIGKAQYYPKAVCVIEFIWQFKCISDLILFTLWHKSLPRQMVEWRLSAWWQVSFNTRNKKILAQHWNHLRHWSKRPPFCTGWPKPRVEWRREGVVTTKGSRKRGQRLKPCIMSSFHKSSIVNKAIFWVHSSGTLWW